MDADPDAYGPLTPDAAPAIRPEREKHDALAARASTYFTLNLEVRGVLLEQRRDAVLRELLPTRESLYGMLRIMLGDVSSLESAAHRGDGSEGDGKGLSSGATGLLELLVRCAADHPARLDGIARMVEALDVLKNDDLTEFRRIWTGVRLTAETLR